MLQLSLHLEVAVQRNHIDPSRSSPQAFDTHRVMPRRTGSSSPIYHYDLGTRSYGGTFKTVWVFAMSVSPKIRTDNVTSAKGLEQLSLPVLSMVPSTPSERDVRPPMSDTKYRFYYPCDANSRVSNSEDYQQYSRMHYGKIRLTSPPNSSITAHPLFA